jgi:trigger factor
LDKFGELPVTIHAHVEVLPEVQLGQYKGLEATRMVRPVTDTDVDRVIDGLRESAASLLPVEDRGAETGDTVTVNFEGVFVNEPEAEHIKVDEVDVEVGGPNVQKEFTENLTGVRTDEEKVFTVKYPEDFSSKGLAGKEVEYTANVTAVRRKDLPEVDDEFAKSLGEEFDSVATLRAKVQEDLAARSRAESDNRLRNEIIGKLVEAHQFEVPASLVDQQADHHLESVVRDMFSRGVDPRSQDFNWDGVREQMKAQAVNDIRASLLLEAIAEDEKIDVSDEEIQVEIDALAASSRQTEEQVRAALTKQGGERSIADRLRNRKALDLLVENARVTDEEWREVEEEASAPAETEESASSGEETDQSEAQTERHNAAGESGNA